MHIRYLILRKWKKKDSSDRYHSVLLLQQSDGLRSEPHQTVVLAHLHKSSYSNDVLSSWENPAAILEHEKKQNMMRRQKRKALPRSSSQLEVSNCLCCCLGSQVSPNCIAEKHKACGERKHSIDICLLD